MTDTSAPQGSIAKPKIIEFAGEDALADDLPEHIRRRHEAQPEVVAIIGSGHSRRAYFDDIQGHGLATQFDEVWTLGVQDDVRADRIFWFRNQIALPKPALGSNGERPLIYVPALEVLPEGTPTDDVMVFPMNEVLEKSNLLYHPCEGAIALSMIHARNIQSVWVYGFDWGDVRMRESCAFWAGVLTALKHIVRVPLDSVFTDARLGRPTVGYDNAQPVTPHMPGLTVEA